MSLNISNGEYVAQNRSPSNIKFIGIDMGEFVRLLDLIFQRVDGFPVRNLNLKDMIDIASKNRTIEQDLVVHDEAAAVTSM